MSAATAYLAIAQWVVPDVAIRAADLAQVPVASLGVGSVTRQYAGAALTLVAAVCTLVGAVLLMRSHGPTGPPRPGTGAGRAPFRGS